VTAVGRDPGDAVREGGLRVVAARVSNPVVSNPVVSNPVISFLER